jgi:hypothetical protein
MYGLCLWQHDKKIPASLFICMALSALIALPVIGFTYLQLNSNPIIQGSQAQNTAFSPPLIYLLSGFGLLLPLALAGIWYLRKNQVEFAWLYLVIWLIIAVIGVYSPTTSQRRLITGVHIPLSILAGAGITRLIAPHFRAKGHILQSVILAGAIPTTLALLVIFTGGVLSGNPKIYLSSDEYSSLVWLKANAAPDCVTLSSPELGSFIPSFTHQRAVAGHGFETFPVEQTRQEISNFYAAATNPDERLQLLKKWNVCYLIVGPRERAMPDGWDFSGDANFQKVFQSGSVQIFSPLTSGNPVPLE